MLSPLVYTFFWILYQAGIRHESLPFIKAQLLLLVRLRSQMGKTGERSALLAFAYPYIINWLDERIANLELLLSICMFSES